MSVTPVARHICAVLLDDCAEDDYSCRPGGPGDPWRQSTSPLNLKTKDFKGKRPKTPLIDLSGEEILARDRDHTDIVNAPKKHPRFGLKFKPEAAARLVARDLLSP